jgi:prevent-host-death family protein
MPRPRLVSIAPAIAPPRFRASCARRAALLNTLDFNMRKAKFDQSDRPINIVGQTAMQGHRKGFREDADAFRLDDSGQRLHEVQASEAKTHLPQLLDEVERGATIVITRHGRRIARLVPEAQRRQQEIDAAIDNIKALGKEIRDQHGAMTIEEILSLRHAGHKY